MKLHFVVGTGRCGSSLVHEILAAHESVGFISNLDDNLAWLRFKGRFNNRLYALTRGAFTRKGGARFAPSEAYRLIGRDISPIYANSCRDLTADDVTPWLRRRFELFFSERWTRQRKACFLHKYTGWSRIGFFAEIFPEARFIHIVRDGRAVANSLLQMPWWSGYEGPQSWRLGPLPEAMHTEWEATGKSFVVLAGMAWRIMVESHEIALRALNRTRYLEIRYEDFLDHPEESLRSMAAFVDLPWSPRLERALKRQRLDASRSRAFERDLTARQLAELERTLGPTLAHYGYAS